MDVNKEKEYNTSIEVSEQEEQQRIVEENNKFFDVIKTTLDTGLNGVTVDKNIVKFVKDVTLPDSKGKHKYNEEIASKLLPEHHAIINLFSAALLQNKPFQYNPTMEKRKSVNSLDLLKRGTNDSKKVKTITSNLEELENLIKQR